MSFLTINGWDIPIINGGISQTSTQLGNVGPSFTNRSILNRRIIPRGWAGSMLFQSPAVADTFEGLLMGRGHHFPFDNDGWSESGISVSPDYYSSVIVTQTLSAFGIGSAELTHGSNETHFATDLPTDKWTMMVWVYNTALSSVGNNVYDHYVEVGNGDQYINGVPDSYNFFMDEHLGVARIFTSVDFPDPAHRIDDLVILPFNVDASFVAGVYAYQTANNCVMQCPFDYPGDFVDRVHGQEPSAAVPATIASGDEIRKSGKGSLLLTSSATDEVLYDAAAGTPLHLDNIENQTISLWLRPTTGAVSPGTFYVAFQGLGAFSSWGMRLQSGNMFSYRGVGAGLGILDSTVITVDEWVHFAMVYATDGSTSSLSLYRNGALVGSDTTAYAIGSSAVDLSIGNATIGFTGNIDDFRYYKSALSPQQVRDVVNEGYFGYEFLPPGKRAFSKLPRLLLHGDVIGSKEQKQVVGAVTSEPYVTTASSPNDRSVDFTLEEIYPLPEEGIPRPDAHFLLEPKFIIDDAGDGVHEDAVAGYEYTGRSGGNPTLFHDSDDNFGFCYSFSTTASASRQAFDLPSATMPVSGSDENFGGDLAGRSAVTVASWFKIDILPGTASSDTLEYIFSSLLDTGGVSKLGIGINAAPNHFFFAAARSSSVDLVPVGGGSAVSAVADVWYFVASVFNLAAKTCNIFGNMIPGGAGSELLYLAGNTGVSWALDHFDADARNTRIGVYGNGNQEGFDGKIKSVMYWGRAVPYHELNVVFEKGYKRRIFR
jgi:hypothetical protein